jgi:hypothetical protein
MSMNDDTFYIYTTGINDDINLINMWFNILYKNILSEIPSNFKNIIVKHYDPIILGSSNSINDDLISRLHDQLFYPDRLPINDLKTPHIVIDMAHIFGYYPTKENKYDAFWSGYYDFNQSYDLNTVLNIKSIYIGYARTDIAECQLIRVYPDGKVITFIDCLIDFGLLIIGEISIDEVIDKQIKILKSKLEKIWKEHGKNILDIDDLYPKYNLINAFIKKLFECTTKEELYDVTKYDLYNNFDQLCTV